MAIWQAILLGAIEGMTEFLPVSSTGHLLLASHALQLHGEPLKSFEVVIQAGALVAVASLYRARIGAMGRHLLRNLLLSFFPAAVVGVLTHRIIKQHLFETWPVVAALALGGLLMIGLDRWLARRVAPPVRSLESLTSREALMIGLAQCVSLWPGMSRAMVTLVAGLFVGLPATAAAEYSFLLALPTLGAATLFDAAQGAQGLGEEVGWGAVACGFVTAAVVATLVMRAFVQYLTRRGLSPFGWYRLGLAAAVWGWMRWS